MEILLFYCRSYQIWIKFNEIQNWTNFHFISQDLEQQNKSL